uniref:2,4-dienoyl-CoA reductase 2 n=1 Tax=Oryctolagus cuniculus TaxID=9986 RepID=A0A5F9DTY7_RABIT
MAQPPPDVEGDDCLPEYRHLFCPDLLRDQVAFITGGGSGIGFRIAEVFMRHGCHTVIASRSLPRVLTVRGPLLWPSTGCQEAGRCHRPALLASVCGRPRCPRRHGCRGPGSARVWQSRHSR